VLRGAVLGLQDGGDSGDTPEDGSEPVEEPPGEEPLHSDQPDNGQGPQKQTQRQHLHLMVELLRPQDNICLVRSHHGEARVVCHGARVWEQGHTGQWKGHPAPSTPLLQLEPS
jgi:hypothetical protein